MLFPIVENLERRGQLLIPYRGVVVANNDSKQIGRVKCLINGIYQTSNYNSLPWCLRRGSAFQGGPVSSDFAVPGIGSEIEVVFPFGDIYHPFYDKVWNSSLTTPNTLWTDDYPNTWGWYDAFLNWFRTNSSYMELFQNSISTMFHIDDSGNLQINLEGDVIWNLGGAFLVKSGDNITFDAGGNLCGQASGDVAFEADGNFGATASETIVLTASEIDENSGTPLTTVATDIATLTSKISDLETQLSTLRNLATQLQNKIDSADIEV